MANWSENPEPIDPVGTVTEADIDTWWNGKDRTLEHGFDDAQAYIMQHIAQGIGAGHTLTHGIVDGGGAYFLTISGPSINKTWNA